LAEEETAEDISPSRLAAAEETIDENVLPPVAVTSIDERL